MSSSTLGSSQPASSPRRSPTEVLWAQVLGKDRLGPSPRNLQVPLPPSAPLDRNATSTRILLHDTQARLEQFSTRADGMLKSMRDATQQLKTVGMLFEKDRDTLTNDMIDLVNRSQTEIQKVVGRPCQENQALTFQDKLELRVEGLNQRLDALHMFNQTHSQAIETQSQTLKSIQDQQNALLAAILPLLPLAQTIPSQIDILKTCIQEVATNVSSSITAFQKDLLLVSSAHFRAPSSTPTRKRRLSSRSTEDLPFLQRMDHSNPPKKIRTDASASLVPTPAVDIAPNQSSGPQGVAGEAFGTSPKTRDIATPDNRTWKLNSGATARHSGLAPPQPQATQNSGSATPDVPCAGPPRLSSLLPRTPSLINRIPAPHQRIRSPCVPDVPADKENSERRLMSATTLLQDAPPANLASIPYSRILTPVARRNINTAGFSGVLAQNNIEAQTTQIYRDPSRQTDTTNQLFHHQPPTITQASESLPVRTQLNPSTPTMNNHARQQRGTETTSTRRTLLMGQVFMPGSKLRDRRPPPREGRRFIPLDDDNDDDEEEDEQ